jgi:hypothetical protein
MIRSRHCTARVRCKCERVAKIGRQIASWPVQDQYHEENSTSSKLYRLLLHSGHVMAIEIRPSRWKGVFRRLQAIETDVRDRHGDEVVFYRRREGPRVDEAAKRYGPGLSSRERLVGRSLGVVTVMLD